MKARLVDFKGVLSLLIHTGKIKLVTVAEARDFLINFNNPAYYSDSGTWNHKGLTMESYSGETVAYVCDNGHLHVEDADSFKNILTNEECSFMTVPEFAELHGKQVAIVRRMCQNGRIDGAVQKGKTWLIPATSPYPTDSRMRN